VLTCIDTRRNGGKQRRRCRKVKEIKTEMKAERLEEAEREAGNCVGQC
jgi:hypothetical protein